MAYSLIIIVFLLGFIIYQINQSSKNQKKKDEKNINKQMILKKFPHLYGVENPLYNDSIIEDYFYKFHNSINLSQSYSDNQSEISNIIDQLYIDLKTPGFFNTQEKEQPYLKEYIKKIDNNLIKLKEFLKSKNVTPAEMWFIEWLYVNDVGGNFRFKLSNDSYLSGVFDVYPNTIFKEFLSSFNELLTEKINKN